MREKILNWKYFNKWRKTQIKVEKEKIRDDIKKELRSLGYL